MIEKKKGIREFEEKKERKKNWKGKERPKIK